MLRTISLVGPAIVPQASHANGISGKLSVPVSPASAVYAHFRHVVGVRADQAGDGVPLYKLRILDNLIETYLAAGADPLLKGLGDELKVPASAHSIDSTIEALGADLRQALVEGAPANGSAAMGQPGQLFSLDA